MRVYDLKRKENFKFTYCGEVKKKKTSWREVVERRRMMRNELRVVHDCVRFCVICTGQPVKRTWKKTTSDCGRYPSKPPQLSVTPSAQKAWFRHSARQYGVTIPTPSNKFQFRLVFIFFFVNSFSSGCINNAPANVTPHRENTSVFFILFYLF